MTLRCVIRLGAALSAALWTWASVAADSEPDAAQHESPPFLEDARSYVMTAEEGRTTLKVDERSLMNWTNPQRLQEQGAVYIWRDQGRPAAIGSFFTYGYDGKIFRKHEFQSLADGPLSATYDGRLAWTPNKAGIEWRDVAEAPAPGSTHVNRMLQMRQLARRYRAEIIDPHGDRNELRLAPRPIEEYSSSKYGIVDGVIFTFVVATDPEVLLMLEAVEAPGESAHYRYALARFSYWNLVVYEGDQQIWSADLDQSHELNSLGDVENMSKVYNSFHPRGVGVVEPVTAPQGR